VVATHGRSLWVIDDVQALQQLTPEVRAEAAHLFPIRPARAGANACSPGVRATWATS
jgi:hypothetical protein